MCKDQTSNFCERCNGTGTVLPITSGDGYFKICEKCNGAGEIGPTSLLRTCKKSELLDEDLIEILEQLNFGLDYLDDKPGRLWNVFFTIMEKYPEHFNNGAKINVKNMHTYGRFTPRALRDLSGIDKKYWKEEL